MCGSVSLEKNTAIGHIKSPFLSFPCTLFQWYRAEPLSRFAHHVRAKASSKGVRHWFEREGQQELCYSEFVPHSIFPCPSSVSSIQEPILNDIPNEPSDLMDLLPNPPMEQSNRILVPHPYSMACCFVFPSSLGPLFGFQSFTNLSNERRPF